MDQLRKCVRDVNANVWQTADGQSLADKYPQVTIRVGRRTGWAAYAKLSERMG